MIDDHFHANHLRADHERDRLRQVRKARELGMGYSSGVSGFRPYQEVAIRWHLEARVRELEDQLAAERRTRDDLTHARRIAVDSIPHGPYRERAVRDIATGCKDGTSTVRAALAGIRWGRANG